MSEKSIKKTQLSPVQAKVAKAKIKANLEGGSITSVAPEIFPNQTPEAARVSMQRVLQTATVQEAIAAAMEQEGLTANSLVGVVADAMKSTKVVQIEGDFFETEVPDHTTRLNAARTAAQWLGVGKNTEGGPSLSLTFVSIAGGDKSDFGL